MLREIGSAILEISDFIAGWMFTVASALFIYLVILFVQDDINAQRRAWDSCQKLCHDHGDMSTGTCVCAKKTTSKKR